MRPAVVDKIIADLEEVFYRALRDTSIAQDIIKSGPHQSIEQLAEIMAEGMKQSVCGDLARELSKQSPLLYYDELCKEAFKNILLKLLNTEFNRKDTNDETG